MIFVADESPFLNPFLSRLQHQLAAGIKSNMKKESKKTVCEIYTCTRMYRAMPKGKSTITF